MDVPAPGFSGGSFGSLTVDGLPKCDICNQPVADFGDGQIHHWSSLDPICRKARMDPININVVGIKPAARWMLARAILEHIEPGAGKHCLENRYLEPEHDLVLIGHPRLGLKITFS